MGQLIMAPIQTFNARVAVRDIILCQGKSNGRMRCSQVLGHRPKGDLGQVNLECEANPYFLLWRQFPDAGECRVK